MTSTEKQYWAGEFTDAELDAAADAGEHAKRLGRFCSIWKT